MCIKTCVMTTEKQCTSCKEVKPLSEFHKNKSRKDGLAHCCGVCASLKAKEYRRTKNGLIVQIYSDQKKVSERRGHPQPDYSRQELQDWCIGQTQFHQLYADWVSSGFSIALTPSCDRTDDYLGYSLNRLQLMTWGANNNKGRADRLNGVNNKQSKAVIGVNKATGVVFESYSAMQAARELGINRANISACCNDRKVSSGGYYWRHKN